MGSYDEAIQAFHDGTDPRPDIEAHRRQGRVKYGTGTSLDYVRAGGVRLYGRAGSNEGTNESFAYTEVNNTAQVWRGIAAALDIQRVANPGYNHDRGPALVVGVRLHVDF
jgi:carbohydrate-selective porin OprB